MDKRKEEQKQQAKKTYVDKRYNQEMLYTPKKGSGKRIEQSGRQGRVERQGEVEKIVDK